MFPLGTVDNSQYTKTRTPSTPLLNRFLKSFRFLVSCEVKGKGKTSSNLSPAEAHIAAAAARANGGMQQEPIQSLEDVIESLAPCYTLLRVTILSYTRKPSRSGNATLNHPTFMVASTWQATWLAKSMMRTVHFCYRQMKWKFQIHMTWTCRLH